MLDRLLNKTGLSAVLNTRGSRPLPVHECAQPHHPERLHYHWGWFARRWEYNEPKKTHPYADTTTLHAKGEALREAQERRSR